VPWVWHSDLHGSHILLSNDNRTVHGGHFDWEKILGGVTWRSGTHKYEVEIDLDLSSSSNSWQIIVGVA
jgi:hypothetical protein